MRTGEPEKTDRKVTNVRYLKNSRESAETGGVNPGREMGLKNKPLNLLIILWKKSVWHGRNLKYF